MLVTSLVLTTQPGRARSVADLVGQLQGMERLSVEGDRSVRATWQVPDGQNAEPEGLSEVLRVIDVAQAAEGRVLRILMNGDLDEAVGVLAPPTLGGETSLEPEAAAGTRPEDHWRWRLRMAQRIAALIDAVRFGVKAAYVFGSTKNGTAGPASDIDLLLHVEGDDDRRRELAVWLDGWSQSLAEVNYLRTGYQTDGLLDVHYVTDADIDGGGNPFAAKIGAITDAARPLALSSATAP